MISSSKKAYYWSGRSLFKAQFVRRFDYLYAQSNSMPISVFFHLKKNVFHVLSKEKNIFLGMKLCFFVFVRNICLGTKVLNSWQYGKDGELAVLFKVETWICFWSIQTRAFCTIKTTRAYHTRISTSVRKRCCMTAYRIKKKTKQWGSQHISRRTSMFCQKTQWFTQKNKKQTLECSTAEWDQGYQPGHANNNGRETTYVSARFRSKAV